MTERHQGQKLRLGCSVTRKIKLIGVWWGEPFCPESIATKVYLVHYNVPTILGKYSVIAVA